MYLSYDFLRVKSASDSDSAVKKLEKKLFTPFLPIFCFRIIGHGDFSVKLLMKGAGIGYQYFDLKFCM